MVRNKKSNEASRTPEEVDRSRKAAEDALLQQLDWTIGYLHGINKRPLSRALAKNRSSIRRQLMGRPEEPVPSQQTRQT